MLPVELLLLPGHVARSVRPRTIPVHGGRPVNACDSTAVRHWPVLFRLFCVCRAGAGTLGSARGRRSDQLWSRLLLLLINWLLLWTLPIRIRRPRLCVVCRRLRRTIHGRGLLRLLLLMTATDIDSGRPERHRQRGAALRSGRLMLLLLLTGHVVTVRHRLGRRL